MYGFGYLYVYMCITSHTYTPLSKTIGNYAKITKLYNYFTKIFYQIPSQTSQSNSMLIRERECG